VFPGHCVEVNFAYTHKFSERLLDKLLRLSDNVTRVETGVILANNLVSGLDNTSPKAGGAIANTHSTDVESTKRVRPYPIPYTLYPIPYTLYPIPYTLYPIPYTLYPIPYTLYLKL